MSKVRACVCFYAYRDQLNYFYRLVSNSNKSNKYGFITDIRTSWNMEFLFLVPRFGIDTLNRVIPGKFSFFCQWIFLFILLILAKKRIESLITIQFLSHFLPCFGFNHQYSFSFEIPLSIVVGYGYTVKHFEII